MSPFAPGTCDQERNGRLAAAVAVNEVFKKLRRFMFFIVCSGMRLSLMERQKSYLDRVDEKELTYS